jgi:hypothetical protein
MMKTSVLTTAALAATATLSAHAFELTLTYDKLWTHTHTTPGQVSEIPAFDGKTNTVWVAGVVGVDVLNAATGELVEHLDTTTYGAINSIAIHGGLAAFAIEATGDRRNPGSVVLFDTRTRRPVQGVSQIAVGSLPDMVTFAPDGRTLLVANEATPNAVADAPYVQPDPKGTVSIVDVNRRSVVATLGFDTAPVGGDNARDPAKTGMDFEPEYIAVSRDSRNAFVTLQEHNALGLIDLKRGKVERIVGLGAKDFAKPGNEIDPLDNDNSVNFVSVPAKALYMPDSIATYSFLGIPLLVMANEGDFREDNVDRVAASTLGGVAPYNRLRVVATESSAGNLYAAGARSFSIRGPNGALIYDSGSLLDRAAHARGIYDDGRSRDKGVEPEGVALLDLGWKTFAFIGLERTTKASVAVFDISNPWNVRFLDLIVTDGDLSPEGLVAYEHRGRYFLAIANEVAATGAAGTNTTVYELGWAFGR